MNGDQWELVLGDETTSCGSWRVSCTTLVKLSRCLSGQVQCPEIKSVSACGGSCAMAVDNVVVHLSKDQELLHMQTKYKVDAMAILEGGYLVMGDSGGYLTIGSVHTDGSTGITKFVSKSSQKVVDSDMDKAFRRVIFRFTDSQVGQVVLLTCSGRLIVVSNIHLVDGDLHVRNACVKTVAVPKGTIDFVNCGQYFVLLGQGETTISVYSMEDELVLNDVACQYEDKEMTHIWDSGGNVFFTMDNQSIVYVWDLLTLVVVETFPLVVDDATDGRRGAVVDLRLIHSQQTDNSIFNLCSLSAVVLFEDSLRMLQLPSLECLFEQKGESGNRLFLTQSPITQDDIFVTQCHTDYDEDDEETFLSMKFLCYTETDSERRLDKLLARKQFDEAQQLIQIYNMEFNMTPYLVQNCMYDVLPTLCEMEKLLDSCRKQIDDCKEKDDLVTSVSAELHELKYRLDVFVQVFGLEAYSPEEWQQFQHADILDLVLTLFTAHKFHLAFDLWHCFQLDMIGRLKPGMVAKMLDRLTAMTVAKRGAISCSSTSLTSVCHKVMDWLVADILPYLLSSEAVAEDLEGIVQWTLNLVEVMESQQHDWPASGIAVCDRMLKCLGMNTLTALDEEAGLWTVEFDAIHSRELMQTLQDTLEALKTVHVLKTRFQCHLSLDIVKKETKESLVYRMLDTVKIVEFLPKVLKTQILPYVEYNKINADQIFASYVKDILQRVSHQPFETSWPTKVQAIVEVIQAPKQKVLSVLNLVEHSKLPFADFVEDLVRSVLDNVKHPLTATLQTQWQTLQASNTLCLYGLEPFSVTPSKALEVARHFILQDRPTSMSDAKTFLQAVGVQNDLALAQFQAMFYIENDRLCDLMHYLKSLPPAVAKPCAVWCVQMAEMTMTSETHVQTSPEAVLRESRLRFLSAGIMLADFLKHSIFDWEDAFQLEEIEMIGRKIHSALSLEKQYEIHLGRFDLEDGAKCVDILKQQIESKQLKDSGFLRIAELLNISKETALCCMLGQAALKGSTQRVCYLTEKLCECPNLSKSSCIYEAAATLVEHQQGQGQQYSFLTPARRLATHALITCHMSEIESRLVLTRRISVLEKMYSQCQEESQGVTGLVKALDVDEGSGHKEGEEREEEWCGSRYSEVKMPLCLTHVTQASAVLSGGDQGMGKMKQDLTELTNGLLSYGHDGMTLDLLYHAQHRTPQLQQQASNKDELEDRQSVKRLINKAVNKVSARILGKVMNQTPSDRVLSLALALPLPHAHLMSLLSHETKPSAAVNHTRLKKILEVAAAYGELHGNEEMVDHCHQLSRQEKWRNRLSKLGLTLVPNESKKSILHAVTSLMLDNTTTFPLVQEFVTDMDLNLDVVQTEYQSHFHNVLAQAAVSHIALDKAQAILESISDEERRLATIKDALPRTSEYNYEGLQFLMEQWDLLEDCQANKKSMELLKLLMEYQRQFPPCDIEELTHATSQTSTSSSDFFFSSISSSDSLWSNPTTTSSSTSSIIQTTSSSTAIMAKVAALEKQQQLVRLPFRLVQGKKLSKIIDRELTTATLPAWQLITSALGSPKDKILLTLIYKLVTAYIKSLGGGGNVNGIDNNSNGVVTNGSSDNCVGLEDDGQISEEFENLLQEIGPILLQMERKECGILLCRDTADRMSRVGDKVRTLESGLVYASKWVEECGVAVDSNKDDDHDDGDNNNNNNNHNAKAKTKAENAVKVFAAKLPPLTIRWLLILAGLGDDEELMPFVHMPEKLIQQLYYLPLKSMAGGSFTNVYNNDHHGGRDNYPGGKRGGAVVMENKQEEKKRFDEADIHHLCEEIARLHDDLDLVSIQTALIDVLLTGSDSSVFNDDADQTLFNVTTDFQLGSRLTDEEESVPRIVSMLRSTNGEAHFLHLMKMIFEENDDDDEKEDTTIVSGMGMGHHRPTLTLKARRTAILCLSEAGHASLEMKQELKLLNQLISLQSLGVHLTQEMYDKADKLPLLLRLWERFKGHQKAGPLLASLCLDQREVTLAIPQLWNSILSQMARFGQVASLRPLMTALMQTRGLEKVKQTDGFIRVKTVMYN